MMSLIREQAFYPSQDKRPAKNQSIRQDCGQKCFSLFDAVFFTLKGVEYKDGQKAQTIKTDI
jgi:hypothetical protein